MMIEKKNIEKIVSDFLAGSDKFLVNVEVGRNGIVEIFIDSDSSISIDDCVGLSRHIETHFDRDSEDFELRVSSAGLDRPFSSLRQYRKYMNRAIEILTRDSEKWQGILLAVDDQGIDLEVRHDKKNKSKKNIINKTVKTNDCIRFAFDEIATAKPAVII